MRELGRQGCGLDHLTHEEEVATGGLRSRDAWGTCKSYRGVIKLPGYELWRRLDLKVYPPEEYAYAPLLSCTRRAPNHCCDPARCGACIHTSAPAARAFTGTRCSTSRAPTTSTARCATTRRSAATRSPTTASCTARCDLPRPPAVSRLLWPSLTFPCFSDHGIVHCQRISGAEDVRGTTNLFPQARTEADVFAALGLEYVAPARRNTDVTPLPRQSLRQ